MTEKPVVLAVLGEVNPDVVSGATRSLLRAVPELESRGWRFVYWTPVPSATERLLRGAGADVRGEIRELKFSLRELRQPPGVPTRLVGGARYMRRFASALSALQPGIVLGNTVGTLPELAAARIRRYPTVLHMLEIMPERPKHRIARRLLSWASDEIIVPSEATAAQFDILGRRAHVAYTGIEPPPRATPRRDEGYVVAGAIGTICRRKGTDVLVEAAELLRERAPAVELRLCGEPIEGAERPAALGVIERAQAAGISYRGQVDVYEELPGWDLLVLPSRQDPFPNVVLEAMSLGVPVVASAVGGIPEQLGDRAGVLVPPGDPRALAEAIESLAREPARREAIGRAGRERVARLFTVAAQADRTEAALEAALARRRRH